MEKLYLNIRGQGNKVIFLHGWNHSHLIWSKILPAFENKFECILIDFPGFGFSNKYKIDDISIDSFSNIIVELINEKFDINDKFNIIGDSLGSLVALQILENYSLKINKTILCGCPIDGLNNVLNIIRYKYLISNSLRIIKKIPSPLSKQIIKFFSLYTVANFKNVSEDIINSVLNVNPKIAEKIFQSISKKHNYNYCKLKKSKSDFLVLRGEMDKVVNRNTALGLAKKLSCEYYEFPQIGHTPQQENPSLFIEKTIDFLNKE